MATSEEQDAQRIALVATLATQMWAAPDCAFTPEEAIKQALNIIRLAEQAVRTPTGDA